MLAEFWLPLKAPAFPHPHWLLMDRPATAKPEKPASKQLILGGGGATEGVNETRSPPGMKVLARCFLEKPSQIKADIENIRLSMRL